MRSFNKYRRVAVSQILQHEQLEPVELLIIHCVLGLIDTDLRMSRSVRFRTATELGKAEEQEDSLDTTVDRCQWCYQLYQGGLTNPTVYWTLKGNDRLHSNLPCVPSRWEHDMTCYDYYDWGHLLVSHYLPTHITASA